MFKRILVATFTLTTAGAVASDYQMEAYGYYSHTNVDENSDFRSLGLGGTYYLSPVQTREYALGEAAFLERADNIRIDVERSEYKRPGYTRYVEDTTSGPDDYDYSYIEVYPERQERGTRVSVTGEWYLPGELFYLGLGINRHSGEFPYEPFENINWKASLGVTPIKGLLVSSEFYEDQDLDQDWNVGAKYVSDSLGPTFAINTNYRHVQGESYITLGIDYYIGRTFSVGIEGQETLFSNSPDIEVRARKFLTSNWSISARYVKTEWLEYIGGETSQVSIATGLRF